MLAYRRDRGWEAALLFPDALLLLERPTPSGRVKEARWGGPGLGEPTHGGTGRYVGLTTGS